MNDGVVLGTGGHARSCLDVLASTSFRIRGCLGSPPDGELQAPYLGTDDQLSDLLRSGVTQAFVAVGSNRLRKRLVEYLTGLGFATPAVIAGSATVSGTAEVGPGAFVMHGAVIGPFSVVERGAIVNTSASVDHDCLIGEFAHVAPGTHLAGTVQVGPGAFLGVGTSVIPHVVIGSWATVGAGSSVIRNVEDETTVAGVPARPMRRKS